MYKHLISKEWELKSQAKKGKEQEEKAKNLHLMILPLPKIHARTTYFRPLTTAILE